MSTLPLFERRGAVFSPCGTYRYSLWREWGNPARLCVWIMLNPSTANDVDDDPTIRRCVAFAKRWRCGSIVVVNLFGLISSDPRALLTHESAVGQDNDAAIVSASTPTITQHVVVAWGAFSQAKTRAVEVLDMLDRRGVQLECLGQTKDGSPRHPLYVAGDTTLVPFVRTARRSPC